MIRVLVVEDEALNGEVLERFLASRGFAVTLARSAEEALALAGQGPYDVVLLDNVLPGKTGLQALPELVERSKAPVVLMTGDAGEETRRDAALLGAAGFVSKPMDFPALADELKRVLHAPPPV